MKREAAALRDSHCHWSPAFYNSNDIKQDVAGGRHRLTLHALRC